MLPCRAAYDEAADAAARAHTDIFCEPGSSLTKQSFTRDADLNVIVERFGLGEAPMPAPINDPSFFGDVSDMPDLRQVMEWQREAAFGFSMLPARLRARFNNSMLEMYTWLQDPANSDEAVSLGLLVKAKPEADTPPAPPVSTSSLPLFAAPAVAGS